MASATAPRYMQPQIILLKEGTDQSQGKGQLLSNIKACLAIGDTIRTTLGPCGMDKLIVDSNQSVTISNDGATILKKLEIVHPAAKLLADIATAQDSEVGDGTTSVVLVACEILKQASIFVEDGLSPHHLIKGLRKAAQFTIQKLDELSIDVSVDKQNEDNFKQMLLKCAKTAMSSKLINSDNDMFADICVNAVLSIDHENYNRQSIGIKKVKGGSLQDSLLVKGVSFKKTFSYAGFEQQPKRIENAKVICLNVELEIKAERDNAEVRIDKVENYQQIVDAEWKIIFDKLENIVNTGANVVLSKLPIGDLATQYFADRNIFCAGRVHSDDLERVIGALGGDIHSTCSNLNKDSNIGQCELFEEKQIGSERYNFFTGCPKSRTCTILLRGGAEQFIDEVERSIHDAIMVVRRSIKYKSIVVGGGAIEMQLSKHTREFSKTIKGKQQAVVSAFAKSLEVIPRQLSTNAGFDPTSILTHLRYRHNLENGNWFGVDISNESIRNNYEANVWEPAIMKHNMIMSATEAACLVLSVDETIKNKQNEQQPQQPQMGGGMPMMG